MDLSTTLWFEIGVAAILGILILWTRVEYGLFLYALALGFPDFAYPLGGTINLRLDDLLIPLFLARIILWKPAALSRRQSGVFRWQAIFLAACALSIAVQASGGNPPASYDSAKMAGCAAIIFVIPRLVQSERRLRFFIAGLACAGLALVIQIHLHLGEIPSNRFATFQQMKSAATFDTWNPNTIGQAAVLLAFAAGLGGIVWSRSLAGRALWTALAVGFALVPPALFVRGTSISVAAGIILYLALLRRWKWVLLFAGACLCALLSLHSQDRQLMKDAASVNVATGEGFSDRYERWGLTLEGIRKSPFVGQGFGQEMNYMTLQGSEGRAHDAYLAVWLELGAGGLFLFLAVIFQYVRAGSSLYRNPRFRTQGALILALLFTLCLDSLGLPTLYWEKLPTIALSLAAAVVGICERSDCETSEDEVSAPAYQPLVEHL